MRRRRSSTSLALFFYFVGFLAFARCGMAQNPPYERAFPQSKATVEEALKELRPSASGRLPVLDGFTLPGEHSLDRLQRGYYQCATQVSPTSAGGTLVRVRAKITAWYSDPVPSKSGYQVLPSNGRLETDFLDRLADALVAKTSATAGNATGDAMQRENKPAASAPAISTHVQSSQVPPAPSQTSKASKGFGNSPFKQGSAMSGDRAASLATQTAVADKRMAELNKEAKSLQEILRNQAHPDNLVAVKKSGTPVLVSPIEGAKVLFLASAEDEFEILDKNANWVHIRISGLSRGWVRRSGVEMPEMSASQVRSAPEPAPANAEEFQVKDEQIATFPGTWEPLRGKTVKIVTVQRASGKAPANDAPAKLEFAKALFGKQYAELARQSTTAAGVVLIFDSEDGGIAAAPLLALEQWNAGTLSEQAFWRRCLLDPPETFISKSDQ